MIFATTLNQTAFLLCFIAAGYILSKCRIVPTNAQTILSKLENAIFIPALVLSTFIGSFTQEKLGAAWQLLLGSLVLALVAMALSFVCVRLCSKDRYERNPS